MTIILISIFFFHYQNLNILLNRLNTRFPSSLCLPCCVRDTVRISTSKKINCFLYYMIPISILGECGSIQQRQPYHYIHTYIYEYIYEYGGPGPLGSKVSSKNLRGHLKFTACTSIVQVPLFP